MSKHQLTEKVPNELLEKLFNLAVRLGNLHDIKLDFTHKSIKDIEKILIKIHEEYRREGNQEGIRGIALECAAYIVETIKKNTGTGEWFRNDSEFGRDSFPFKWKDGIVLYPYSWCQKRIFDGSGEDIWSKYNVFVLMKLEK